MLFDFLDVSVYEVAIAVLVEGLFMLLHLFASMRNKKRK